MVLRFLVLLDLQSMYSKDRVRGLSWPVLCLASVSKGEVILFGEARNDSVKSKYTLTETSTIMSDSRNISLMTCVVITLWPSMQCVMSAPPQDAPNYMDVGSTVSVSEFIFPTPYIRRRSHHCRHNLIRVQKISLEYHNAYLASFMCW